MSTRNGSSMCGVTDDSLVPHAPPRISSLGWRVCAIALLLCGAVGHADAAYADDIQVGVAHETFVLPTWVPLAGYSRRHGAPSQGVHDPVGVRALVVQDATTTAALVSCDLLIIDEQLFSAVRQQLRAQPLPKNVMLLLAATHTHSGPGAYGTRYLEKISMGHFDQRVFDALVQSITRAVVRAYEVRRPSRMAYGAKPTQGLVVNRMDPRGVVDDELIVSAFYPRETDDPFAILVSFSAHPTTLGAGNRLLSADYPGALMTAVEQRFPTATCLFVAGSVGDQAPTKLHSGFERTERLGTQLAQETAAILAAAHPEPADSIAAAQETFTLPPARMRVGARLSLPSWLSRQFVDDDATVSVLRIGRTVFFGVPCDFAADLGGTVKAAARSRGFNPMVVGFTDDYIGYCLSEERYRTGRYEALMAFNGPRTGPLIIEQLVHMLDGVATSDKPHATRSIDATRP